MRHHADTRPDRVAYTFLDEGAPPADVTYGELDASARAIAAELQETGEVRGERVAIIAPTGPDFIRAFFGAVYAGAAAMPLAPRSPKRLAGLVTLLQSGRPRFAVISEGYRAKLAATPEAAAELGALRLLTAGGHGRPPEAWRPPQLRGDSLALLQYTSGSISLPRGVMVSHANLLHNERMISSTFGTSPESTLVSWLPLFHDMGLIGNVLHAAYLGARCVLLATTSFLRRPASWLEAITRSDAYFSGAPNFAYEYCVEKIAAEEFQHLDLRGWRVAYNGAEPVRHDTLLRFARRFAGVGFSPRSFHPCYGLAEGTLFVSGRTWSEDSGSLAVSAKELEHNRARAAGGREPVRTFVSCGTVPREQQVVIVEPESGAPVGPGGVGEVWLAGPSVACGYFGEPEATDETFGARLPDGRGPFLRTGDLGFTHGGQLFITGRLKDLVVIRGRNYYPHDLERTVERCHPLLRSGTAACLSVEQDGEERVVIVQELRARNTNFEAVVRAIRVAIFEEHEVDALRVVFVRAGSVPKTSSGKLRRRACLSQLLAGELPVLFDSPGAARGSPTPLDAEGNTPALRRVRNLVARALRLPPGAVEDERPLVELGLDSLSAAQLREELLRETGADALTIEELLSTASVRSLTDSLGDGPADKAQDVSPSPFSGEVSEIQRQLWILEDLAPGTYNIPFAIEIKGELDQSRLGRALDLLIARHEALRTAYHQGGGEVTAQVAESVLLELATEDLRGKDAAGRAACVQELARADAALPFDLGRAPLMRARLMRLSSESHLLVIVVHHLVADGWSVGILVRDLAALYAGSVEGLTPARPFSGEVARLRTSDDDDRRQRSSEFWRARLSGAEWSIDLPRSRPRRRNAGGGAIRVSRAVSEDVKRGIEALARREGVTPFVVMLSAFGLLLRGYSGQTDLAIGSAVADRGSPSSREVVGPLINTVVFRLDVAGNPTFAEILRRVRSVVSTVLDHAAVPFDKILRTAAGGGHGAPPFEVMAVYEPTPPEPLSCGGLRWEAVDLNLPLVPFDLTLMARAGRGEVSIAFDADATLFDSAAVEKMLAQYVDLLALALAAPERRCSQLSPWHWEEVAPPTQACPASETPLEPVHTAFSRAARLSPEAPAIIADETWSYARLQRTANMITQLVPREGGGPERLVGVHIEEPALRFAAVLGVLQAGAAFLPLDTELPEMRLAWIARDAAPVFILADRQISWFPSERVVQISAAMQADDEAALIPVAPEQLAYVLYTSGSTGEPLGVAVPHRALGRHCEAIVSTYELRPSDRVLQFASFGFDVWIEELFPTLSAGGAVVPVTDRSLNGVRRTVERYGVTILNLPSRYWEVWSAETGTPPDSLRVLVVGSEQVSSSTLDAFRTRFPHVACLHAYGLTEAAVTSTVHRVENSLAGGRVPLGEPLPGTTLYVLDAAMRPVGAGGRGELYVGGLGLARGYLRAPHVTAGRFVPNPFDAAGERLFQTGDMVRRRFNGGLEYLGRGDHQMKVRGHRIEASEVEEALRRVGAREAVVVARDDILVAYVEPGRRSLEEMRALAAAELPRHLLPTRWVVMDSWPRTTTGKIDRRRLPQREEREAAGNAPRGAVEEALAAIYESVLGVQNVMRETDFFDEGGHSLAAMRVVAGIERRFGVALPVRAVFKTPVLRDLAQQVEQASAGRVPATATEAVKAPKMEITPLTPVQRRLWFIETLQPGTARYNMPLALVVSGPLDEKRFARAFDTLIERHEALRTSVTWEGACAGPRASLEVEAVTDMSEAERRATELAQQPFNVEGGPLVRARLFRVSDTERLIAIVIHHLVCDGRSLQIIIEELCDIYRAGTTKPLPGFRYADYALHESRRDYGEGVAFWAERLAGSEPVSLPYDGAENAGVAGRIKARLPVSTSELEALSRRAGVTLHMTLVGMLQVLLYRYSGGEDVRIAIPVANRPREELDRIVGCFVNTVIFRERVKPDEPFITHLRQVKQTALEAYEYQDTPFEEVVAAVRPGRGAGTPLIEVMLLVEPESLRADLGEGLGAEVVELENGAAKFDLTVTVRLNGRIVEADVEYDEGRFRRASVESLLESLQELVKSIIREPEGCNGALRALSAEAERRVITWESGGPVGEARLIHQRVREQAARTPDAVALESARPLTYRELEERSNQVAHGLAKRGVGAESLVGLRMSRTEDLVVGMLGVLKTGAAYVPIDPEYPAERQSYIETDSGLAITLKGIGEFAREQITPFPADVSPDGLAYVIYTSGSEGRPKGVAITHASVSALLDWVATAYSAAELQRVLAATSVCFDLSVFEIYGPLSVGGTVVLVENVMELPQVEDLTLVNTVPSAMGRLVKELPESVTTVNLAGEVLPRSLVDALYGRGVAAVWNLYGPSEDTTYSTAALIPREASGSPEIGRAVPGTSAYVLDERMMRVPPNARGELYLAGAGVARGYVNRPAQTAERFVPNPYGGKGERVYRTGDIARYRSDGALEYLGRRDRQVKVRGYRIEPGEVEDTLRRAGAVEAVVLPRNEGLVAYVEVESVSLAALRAAASEALPRYMLPTRWVEVREWSRTPSGKIDRASLPEPEESQDGGSAPRGPVEVAVAEIYCAVLGLKRVGREANFFELGGHSLLALQIVGRIRNALGVVLPVRDVFEAPTVADLAERVARAQKGSRPHAVTVQGAIRTTAPLTTAQRRLWFMNQLVPGTSQYNVPVVLSVEGALDITALSSAFGMIVSRHESLRTTFAAVEGVPVQRIQPSLTPPVTVVDLDDGEVESFVARNVGHPFRLDEGPLFRVNVVRSRGGQTTLVIVMHHIICDEWSLGVLLREFSEFYGAAREGCAAPSLPAPTQMADFAEWEASEGARASWDEHRRYWKRRLQNLAPVGLPGVAEPTRLRAPRGSYRAFTIDRATVEAVHRLALAEQATPSMVMLAAFLALLNRYTGGEDIAVGMPVANRIPWTESSIGFFVNELVLRVDLSGRPTFAELVGRVREAALSAYAHQELPFDEIVAAARTEHTRPLMPLVNVQFDSHTAPFGSMKVHDLTLRPRTVARGVVQFDLQLSIEERSDGMECFLGTNAERINEAWAQAFAHDFVSVVREAIASPGRRVNELHVAWPGANAAPERDLDENFTF
jgi:amino acid adenylation domain-containing protein